MGLAPTLACALAIGVSGCGGLAREVVREATPGLVEGSVRGLNTPGLQRDLAEGVDPQAVELLAERVSGSVVDGTLRALADPARREALRDATGGLRLPLGIEHLDDVSVVRAADGAVAAAIRHIDDEQVRAWARSAVDEAVRTAFTAGRDELGGLADPGTEGLGRATREVAKQATLGFQDALDEIRRERESGAKSEDEGSILFAASKAVESGEVILDVWRVSLIMTGIALLLAIGWAVHRSRVHRQELAQRDEALLRLTPGAAPAAVAPP